MKTTRLLKKIKKGFTLLELTIAMLATSLLLTGFTVFTVFFSNQYQYEMSINDKENSAISLKYSLSNNIEKFNYTYERSTDFLTNQEGKLTYNEEGNMYLFSTLTPIEVSASETQNFYSGVIIKNYKFVLQNEEKGERSYFGYEELIYTFKNGNKALDKDERETELRQYANTKDSIVSSAEYIIYETLSRMVLDVSKPIIGSTSQKENAVRYTFTIQYDFASDAVSTGTKHLTFYKYIYFVS